MYVCKEGTVAEYGMLAKDNIEEGEVLFTIPRSALLHPGTTKVSTLLEKGEYHYKDMFSQLKLRKLHHSVSLSSTREILCGELVWLGFPAAGPAV